jgi:N-acetylmuramic acid 6-phosphate etherase
MAVEDLASLATETPNPRTRGLDRISTLELVQLINAEDGRIAGLVNKALPEIARAIDGIAARMDRGGRLIYMGAGTSGRLGVLDAVECQPTFSVSRGVVNGIIAGGEKALWDPVEGAEDQGELGEGDLRDIQLAGGDSVVGITASGRTPYVIGGLRYAQKLGALTIGLACNEPNQTSQVAEISITIPTGPEVLSGSTRMKAGTATKMVLNMLSTGVMVRLGKTYDNLMVNLHPTNEKLRQRALHLVQQVAGVERSAAQTALESCNWEVKTAILTCRLHLSPQEARERLCQSGGHLGVALGEDQDAE